MSVASTAAITSIASVSAAKSARAKKEACKVNVDNFDSYKATTQEKREYADCVQYLYPDPMSSGTAIAVKVAIVFVIVCTLFGFFKGLLTEGFEESLLFGLIGLCASALFVLLSFLAVVGLQFVFS